jgi:hypothetical protein
MWNIVGMPVTIPPALARNVIENWGDDGARWLGSLPGLLATASATLPTGP